MPLNLKKNKLQPYVWVGVCLLKHFATRKMQHKVNFKWSKVGLNSMFSFSLTAYLTKVKEPCLPYLIINW